MQDNDKDYSNNTQIQAEYQEQKDANEQTKKRAEYDWANELAYKHGKKLWASEEEISKHKNTNDTDHKQHNKTQGARKTSTPMQTKTGQTTAIRALTKNANT